jgi:pimeloyl-ACP methyl ester carboxylesterase
MRKTVLVILVFMILTACAPTVTPDPLSSGAPVTVDVNGRSFVIFCFGAGNPVVVLENGLGVDWSYWKKVYTGMPADIRVCMYTRSSSSHTSLEFVEDLHALLAGAHLEGPYVLVGHSFGGLNVILYADRYPEEVAGIVLEDSSHPDQDARFLAVLPPESPNDSVDLKDLRQWLSTPQYDISGIDWATSCEQVRQVKSVGDIPLIVLTAAPSYSGWGSIPEEIKTLLVQEKQEMPKELARLSSNGTQIIATTTNHMIHYDEPQLVIDAIITLVNAVRNR